MTNAATKKMMLFNVGNKRFAMDISYIKKVHTGNDISFLSNDGKEEKIRIPEGIEMPLHNLPAIFNKRPSDYGKNQLKVLCLNADGKFLAIGVDHIEKVINIPDNDLESLPPIFRGESRKWFPFIFIKNGELIPVIDPLGIININNDDTREEIL